MYHQFLLIVHVLLDTAWEMYMSGFTLSIVIEYQL